MGFHINGCPIFALLLHQALQLMFYEKLCFSENKDGIYVCVVICEDSIISLMDYFPKQSTPILYLIFM